MNAKFAFVWRDTVAVYNAENGEFTFTYDHLMQVRWENHPEDMVTFIRWIEGCQLHKETGNSEKLETIELY